jgi:predicted nucleic acid-binding protein
VSETGLGAFLGRHRLVGLDTSILIYAVEANPQYLEVVLRILSWIEGPLGRAVTSTITMLELLVQPYRLWDLDRVNQFYALLSTYPHLEWAQPTLQIADRAAQLRAEYNLSTPDALQAATALERKATGFITNDAAFRRVRALEVLLLDDLAARP